MASAVPAPASAPASAAAAPSAAAARRRCASWWPTLTSGAFLGSSLMVCVGYFDPGNWATDIGAGSAFGYAHLSVVALSSLVAIFLQILCARLGIVAGVDLARACRERYPRRVTVALWLSAELAIAATDMAEVIGSAVALKLLFGLPTVWGVWVTALDVLLLLALAGRRSEVVEGLVGGLVLAILICFIGELAIVRAPPLDVLRGFVPQSQLVTDPAALLLAIGIIGATIMPHNLYLGSSLVRTGAGLRDPLAGTGEISVGAEVGGAEAGIAVESDGAVAGEPTQGQAPALGGSDARSARVARAAGSPAAAAPAAAGAAAPAPDAKADGVVSVSPSPLLFSRAVTGEGGGGGDDGGSDEGGDDNGSGGGGGGDGSGESVGDSLGERGALLPSPRTPVAGAPRSSSSTNVSAAGAAAAPSSSSSPPSSSSSSLPTSVVRAMAALTPAAAATVAAATATAAAGTAAGAGASAAAPVAPGAAISAGSAPPATAAAAARVVVGGGGGSDGGGGGDGAVLYAGGRGADKVTSQLRSSAVELAASLLLAFFVNAAILITAAAAFNARGLTEVVTLEDAHALLAGVVGDGRAAAVLFGAGLLASGQSSTITGTLAGQVVMEGFLDIRVAPALRRVLTRLLAIVPAAVAVATAGDAGLNGLLIFSQVALSFQLPLAVVPLLQCVTDERLMGAFAVRGCAKALGWAIAALITSLNVVLVVLNFTGAGHTTP